MEEGRKFFKSGILMTLVGLAIRTAAMLFGAFVSRTVGAEGMGLYTLVMTGYSSPSGTKTLELPRVAEFEQD